MNNLSQSFKLGLIILALTSISACSSSPVEEGAPVETAGDVTPDANTEAATDAVPGADPSLDPSLDEKTPESIAATPDAIEPAVVPAADPALDAPVTETVAATPVADPALDAPITETQIADAPIADAPIVDAPVVDTVVAAEPVKTSKHAKHSKQSTSANGSGYSVKKGDTLMKIAFEQYGDLYRWKEIYEANRANIQDPNHVPPGTQLTLNGAGMVTIERNGESYLIKRGDTLGVISNDVYGTTRKWKKLWENNRQLIKDPNKIYAGFYLYYQPESKLTHDDLAPGLKKEDSAANTQKVSAAPRTPASANTTAPAAAVPAKN